MPTSIDATYFNRALITTPGRAHLILSQIEKRLRDDERAAVLDVLEEAKEAAALAVDLAGARRAQGRATYGEASRELDRQVDIATGAVYQTLSVQQRLHEGTQAGDDAQALLDTFFPRGLSAVSNASYPDQLGAIERLLRKAQEPELADKIGAVAGLGDMLGELTKRADGFRDALDRDARDEVSFREVRTAAQTADIKLRYLVMMIMVLYRGNDDDAALRRATLLEPYTRQTESMRQRRSRNVPLGDVDPATGDLVEEALGDEHIHEHDHPGGDHGHDDVVDVAQ